VSPCACLTPSLIFIIRTQANVSAPAVITPISLTTGPISGPHTSTPKAESHDSLATSSLDCMAMAPLTPNRPSGTTEQH
ncbi:hypothetical protein F5Y16DRAFT_387650, partial [Xylariaceae sp. FL0255]